MKSVVDASQNRHAIPTFSRRDS